MVQSVSKAMDFVLQKLTDKPILYISHGLVPTYCDDDEKIAADDGNDDDDDSAHK